MADWHLNELREALKRSGWCFVAEHESKDNYTSASWEFVRDSGSTVFIDFDGTDELRTLPIEESFGCSFKSDPLVSLYFPGKGKKGSTKRDFWKDELRDFVNAVSQAQENYSQ